MLETRSIIKNESECTSLNYLRIDLNCCHYTIAMKSRFLYKLR